MVLVYLPTFARTKSPSVVGKYLIHGAYGVLVGGFSPPTPLKNDGVKVSWDEMNFPIYGKIKNVPNHQPA